MILLNLPNKLTLLRIILVPFFIVFLLLTQIPHSFLIALIIFILASVTDFFDGKLARKNDQITNFGKFADPLADKILVISAFLCFIQLGIVSCVPVIVVLFREFTVTSIRLVAASKGKVVAANMWGKTKTVSQIIAIVGVIAIEYFLQLVQYGAIQLGNNAESIVNILSVANAALVWISVVFTVISGVVYLFDNKDCLKDAK